MLRGFNKEEFIKSIITSMKTMITNFENKYNLKSIIKWIINYRKYLMYSNGGNNNYLIRKVYSILNQELI